MKNEYVFNASVSVTCTADGVQKGGGALAFTLPANVFMRHWWIHSSAPGGTAGGTKSIDYSLGTALKADDGDLCDHAFILSSHDSNFASMQSYGSDFGWAFLTAAYDMYKWWGLASCDGSGLFRPTPDGVAEPWIYCNDYAYSPTAMPVYVNMIAKASDATANPGTVTCDFNVHVIYERLPS
jgi:hypothetical protein